MTSGVPWSVKGINPRAREIAKDLARRDGMTLGGWINKLIMYDLAEGDDVRPTGFLHAKSGPTVMEMPRYGQPVSPRMEAMGHPADEVSRVASALDAFSERIEAAERRSSSAINGMDHSVRGVLQRLAMADREQVQVAARFEDLASEIKTEQTRAGERLRRLEIEAQGPRSAEALRSLEGALGKLAGRLYEDEARTREQISELQARPAGGPVDLEALVEAVVSRVSERLEAAHQRTGEALRDLGSSFTVLDRRLRAVESQAGPDLEQRFSRLSLELGQKIETSRLEMAVKLRDTADGSFDRMESKLTEMAAHVQAAEQRSVQAMEKMGLEVVGLADSLNRRIQGSESRSAQAIEQAGGEMSRISAVMEQRLGRADNVQAQALEKLGSEIARITERLAERISNAERRNALAIDDVGEQLSRVTERLNQRHERGSADLAERIRLSEERTARLLEDARAKIDNTLSRRVAEPAAASAAPISLDPTSEQDAQPVSPFSTMAATFAEISAEPVDDPPPLAPHSEPEDVLEPFSAAAFPSTAPGQPQFDSEDFDAADDFKAIEDYEFQVQADPSDDAYSLPSPFGTEPPAPMAGFEDVRIRSSREVIEQARAAARAASQPDGRGRKGNLGVGFADSGDQPSRGGSLFTGFSTKPKKPAGSTLQTLLIFSGTAAMLGAGLAAYYLGVAEPNGASSVRMIEARNAQMPADTKAAAADTIPAETTAQAAVVLTPAPVDAALGAGQAVAPGKDPVALYADGVRRIEAKDVTGVDALRKAANQGYTLGQFYLAKLYENGEGGLKKDPVAARQWTERAAQAGNVKAMHNLGLYYFEGSGGVKNSTTAAQWFRRAADMGFVDSQYNLARLYEEGLGVGQNAAESYKWYLIASRNGDSESQKTSARIKSQLSAEAQSAAERSAVGFKPTTPNPSQAASIVATGGAAGVATAQKALSKLGYYQGPQDGTPTPALKLAIAAYQLDQGVTSTGNLDPDLLSKLQVFAR